MRKRVVGVVGLLVFLGGCAAGSTDASVAAAGGDVSQFFLGIWHGVIAPATLAAEIINRFAPGVLPWKPHFFQAGAGVAYDTGFFLTVTSSLHGLVYWKRRKHD